MVSGARAQHGRLPTLDTNRVLATVLFTDIVGSTELATQLGDRRWAGGSSSRSTPTDSAHVDLNYARDHMAAANAARRSRVPSARALGALAVVGVVVAFSLSSTLVKRAETPGVLVAFWRLIIVSIVWNGYLWSTGRRVTMRDVRQALVPGIFFGLNLAIFFAGATNNSVANAALIGSLAPFLIVPIGAWLFRERLVRARAGVRGPRVRRSGPRALQRAHRTVTRR